MNQTIKEYYNDPLLGRCKAKIVDIDNDNIILDKTIAFPEGGGQEGDRGEIILQSGEKIAFIDAQKTGGRQIFLKGFPIINVDTEIKHIVAKGSHIGEKVKVGDEVTVQIDISRRENLTISHSASHLLYIGAEKIRPGITKNIIGCHISENSARFDFRTEQNFNQEEIQQIKTIVDEYVANNYKINIYSHEEEEHALYWECNGFIIPCGGTHLESTGTIGETFIKRKNLGKGKERLIISFPDCKPNLNKYIY